MKNIIILGGGSAGWITALFCSKVFPNHNITVIESSKIGIIGVGEGGTPPLISFLEYLGINVKDLINKTNGTLKLGVSLENWNGDGKRYFHAFGHYNEADPFKLPPLFDSGCFSFYLKNLINNNLNFNNYVYSTKLAYANKVDLNNADVSIHFDAFLFANYLKDKCIEKGVKYVDAEFEKVLVNEQNDIIKICLKDEAEVDVDFIFDCSGFARLLIGDYYKSKWIDYSKYLPMKKAVLFPTDKFNEINPYTTAKAMKYGWVFKIPLQTRIGRGYIFDSNYINEQQAIDELKEHYNDIDKTRIISFSSGRFEKNWINNCISIGLSTHFLEPLEATSLWISISHLMTLKHFIEDIFNKNQKSIDLYNEITTNAIDDSMNFIYLHYLTKRKDSLFWKEYRNKNIIPNSLSNILTRIEDNTLTSFNLDTDRKSARWDLNNFLYIANGLEMFKKTKDYKFYNNLQPNVKDYKKIIDQLFEKSVNHSHYLNLIKN